MLLTFMSLPPWSYQIVLADTCFALLNFIAKFWLILLAHCQDIFGSWFYRNLKYNQFPSQSPKHLSSTSGITSHSNYLVAKLINIYGISETIATLLKHLSLLIQKCTLLFPNFKILKQMSNLKICTHVHNLKLLMLFFYPIYAMTPFWTTENTYIIKVFVFQGYFSHECQKEDVYFMGTH